MTYFKDKVNKVVRFEYFDLFVDAIEQRTQPFLYVVIIGTGIKASLNTIMFCCNLL